MSEPIESMASGTTVATLDSDERAELERLRGEVAALRVAKPRRRRAGGRSVAAAVLIVLGCLLAPVALVAVWVNNQVSDTDRFVASVGPLIQEPSVQAALTDRVTDTVFSHLDVQALANDAVDALAAQGLSPELADRLQALTGPLASSVHGFVRGRVAALMASPEFAAAWERAIRVAHEQMTGVLSGDNSAVTVQGGDVRLDLAPFIDAAKQQLVAAGLTAANRVPEVHPTITVTDARNLVRAQTAYNTLDRLATWLPWIVLLLVAAGIYVAREHRRALLATGLGIAAGMLVLAAALFVTRSLIVNAVPNQSVTSAGASYDIVVRFLRTGLRAALVLGLVLALGAFLTGQSTTAVGIRSAASRLLNWLRQRGARAGLRTGPVGRWVHTYRTALRIAMVALAVLVFVFVDQPSGVTVLLIAAVLVVLLGVIQFLDSPVEAAESAAAAPGT